MKKTIVSIFMISLMISCGSSESKLKKWVMVKLNYYRVNQNIVLGIEILNKGNTGLSGLHSIVFMVNEKEHESPFEIPKFWLFKVMHPNRPKYLVEYMKVDEIISLLGPGVHKIKLKYGPVFSNEIEIEVTKAHLIKENKIYFSPYMKEIGDGLLNK